MEIRSRLDGYDYSTKKILIELTTQEDSFQDKDKILLREYLFVFGVLFSID